MQQITPYLFYEDVQAALEFLARAFGFEETLRYQGAQGYVNHAEMRLGEGTIMLGDPGEQYRNPRRNGEVSSAVHVTVPDVQATFERANVAGAQVIEPPSDQPYGGRRFGASDPEGQRAMSGGSPSRHPAMRARTGAPSPCPRASATLTRTGSHER